MHRNDVASISAAFTRPVQSSNATPHKVADTRSFLVTAAPPFYHVVRCSRGLLQRGGVDRHLPQPFAGSGEDRISDCRNDGGSPALAHTTRRLSALNDMNLDRGRLIDAQHLVVMEIALLDAAILQRDLTMERARDPKNDRALDLRLDGVGIDDGTTIDCADDASDTNRSVLRHFDLGDLRHVGRKDELKGDATADSLREWLSPAGLFRGQREDGFGTR